MARRSFLFVDRFVATLPIPFNRQQDVVDRIPETPHPYWRIAHFTRRSLYRTKFQLALASNVTLPQRQFDALETEYEGRTAAQLGPVAYVSCDPIYRTQRFLRFEFSPNAAGSGGRTRLRRFLELLLADGYRQAISEARITRLDIGFDVYRQPLRDLAISFRQGRKTRGTRVITGGDGEVESIYTPGGATRQLAVYDKTREINFQARKAASESSRRYVLLADARTRFEYRWRKESFSWHDVGNLGNPFVRYDVREYQRNEPLIDAAIERLLFDAAASRNVGRLLGTLDGNSAKATSTMRRLLREAFARCPSPVWWDPVQIWTGLPAAIAEIGLYRGTRSREDWAS